MPGRAKWRWCRCRGEREREWEFKIAYFCFTQHVLRFESVWFEWDASLDPKMSGISIPDQPPRLFFDTSQLQYRKEILKHSIPFDIPNFGTAMKNCIPIPSREWELRLVFPGIPALPCPGGSGSLVAMVGLVVPSKNVVKQGVSNFGIFRLYRPKIILNTIILFLITTTLHWLGLFCSVLCRGPHILVFV